MNDFLQQLQAELDEAAQASGKWLSEIAKEADRTFNDTADEIAQAISPVVTEINQRLDESQDATELFIYQTLTPWIEDITAPINNTVTPYFQEHHTCIGCKYYNGSEHGGNMLVCGMHPYGPDDETCQDWESVWVSKG